MRTPDRTRVTAAALALAVAVLLAACGSGEEAPAGGQAGQAWTDLTVQELAGMLESKDFLLVNVHIPYEGEISGTDEFIAYDRIGDQLDRLPDRDAKIVLYCMSGRMSLEAVQTLASAGYTNLYDVPGGMQAWTAAGYDLDHRDPPPEF